MIIILNIFILPRGQLAAHVIVVLLIKKYLLINEIKLQNLFRYKYFGS